MAARRRGRRDALLRRGSSSGARSVSANGPLFPAFARTPNGQTSAGRRPAPRAPGVRDRESEPGPSGVSCEPEAVVVRDARRWAVRRALSALVGPFACGAGAPVQRRSCLTCERRERRTPRRPRIHIARRGVERRQPDAVRASGGVQPFWGRERTAGPPATAGSARDGSTRWKIVSATSSGDSFQASAAVGAWPLKPVATEPGATDADADVVLPQLLHQRVRERVQAGLGGGVAGAPANGFWPARLLTLTIEPPPRRFRCGIAARQSMKGPVQVGAEHGLPVGGGQLLDLGQLHVGGVVDDDVEPAEGRNGLLDEPGDVGFLRHVRLDAPGRPGAPESGHGPVQVSLGPAGNRRPWRRRG